MRQVTDPALLAQLNGTPARKPVTDPALLAQLNSESVPEYSLGKSLLGMGENVLSGVTGLAGQLRGGVRNIAEYTAGIPASKMTGADVARDWTYQPRTDIGKAYQAGLENVIGKPVKAVEDWAAKATVEPVRGQIWDQQQHKFVDDPNIKGTTLPKGVAVAIGAAPTVALGATGALPFVKATPAIGRAAQTAASATGRAAVNAVSAPIDYFRPSVVAEKYLQKNMGRPEQLPPIVDALRAAAPEQTAAEALTKTPQGAIVQALQESMARNPTKGIAIDFNEQFQRHKQAIQRESSAVEDRLAPERTQAIDNIRKQGGIRVDDFMARLDALADTPEAAGNPMAGTVIKTLKRIVAKNSKKAVIDGKETLVIDPAIIYDFRKTGLNQTIANAANGIPSAVNAGKIGVGKSVRALIDDEFKAGGGGAAWGSYLREYSKSMEPISAREMALDERYSPEFGKAGVPGGTAQAAGIHGPMLLSRPVALTNFGLGLRTKLLEPSVDKYIADQLRNPGSLAEILAKVEKRQQPITDTGRLLPEFSSVVNGLPDQPIAGARYGAFGDSRTAPPGIARLPAPGQEVGGANYHPAPPQNPVADALAMSASEQKAALRHPAGPDLAGPRLQPELTASAPSWTAPESLTPPVEVALAKVMSSAPQLTPLARALMTRRNNLPGRSSPAKLFEDQSLSLAPEDMSPSAQSAKAARERGRKLEDALLGRKRK